MKDAIYIPAYSDGLMTFLENDDKHIREVYQPDYDKKKSFRIYNEDFDSYYNRKDFEAAHYMLVSAGVQYKRDDLRSKINADKATVFIDSGGYQLAQQTVNYKTYTDKIALEWSEKNGDIFPILDRPTFSLGMMRDGKPVSPYKDYQECLDLSVNSAKYYHENRTNSKCAILNVLQGRKISEIQNWYKHISKYKFEGWGLGGTRGNLGRIVPAMLFLIEHGEFAREECKWFHVFGVTSNESMVYFQYLQMLLNKYDIDVQITYDSTAWNRGCVYGNYMLRPKYVTGSGMESMSWSSNFDYKKMAKDFKLPCSCPVCSDIKDVYGFFNYYEMKENKETKKVEETIVFKKYNTTIGFHNLYLQLDYLENVQRVLDCGIPEVYQEFFPKKIADNLFFLDRVFENPEKDWEGELNVRFLDTHIKNEMKSKKDDSVEGGIQNGLGL